MGSERTGRASPSGDGSESGRAPHDAGLTAVKAQAPRVFIAGPARTRNVYPQKHYK